MFLAAMMQCRPFLAALPDRSRPACHPDVPLVTRAEARHGSSYKDGHPGTLSVCRPPPQSFAAKEGCYFIQQASFTGI